MDSNTVRIVAVEGRLVRDPATQRPIDADGIDIDLLDFNWTRLIADGDVAFAPADEVPAPAPAASKSASAPTAPAQEA